jgi:hypothetical protein
VIAAGEPAGRHPLHAGPRIWPESNCYVDLWIGLLHHLRLEPEAMLACAASPRFEGDQWTFCKPTATELARLYGLRVEELSVWSDLRGHVAQQIARGRVVLLETDGYFLPDTRGVSYGIAHQKTTIGVLALDLETRAMSYLHNAGRFTLDGDDLDGALASGVTATVLPPFAELVDLARHVALAPRELRARSLDVAAVRLSLADGSNPFGQWADAAGDDLARLAERDLAHFHAWAFASIRQAGSMSELLAAWCAWLGDSRELTEASAALLEVAQTLAAQQFRLARVPVGGKHPDLADALRRCGALWERASAAIATVVASRDAADGRPSASRAGPLVRAR